MAFRERRSGDADDGWNLLGQIFDFHFKPHNPTEPFGPMAIMEGKRSMIPDDLTDDQLEALKNTLDGIEVSEYRARVADTLWLRRHDPDAARIAVDAYLESATLLEDPHHWTASMERYERAVRLARQIEPKGDLPQKILAHLETRVRHYDGNDPLYFTCKALELLEEFRFGDFPALAEIAGRVAGQARTDGDFRRARSHYNIQAKLYRRAKTTVAAETAQVSSAECFIEEAEAREAEGSFMAAHHFWQDAINACRDRPSMRQRIPELQKRLSIAGEKMRDEMQSFSQEVDIREYVEAATNAVTGLSWDDAFFTLVTCSPLISFEELRKISVKQIEDHPLQAIMAVDIFDATGRKVGVRPSAVTDDPEQYETAITGFMEQNANFQRGLAVHGWLVPTIQKILEEHEVNEHAIEIVIGDSAFIPEDRKPLFIKAFVCGFQWDFSTALHILVPQIENGIRKALGQAGITPVNIDADGIEEVWGYERILNHDETKKIFGQDFVFELKSLLVERLGQNMRNLLAHGLLSPDSLNNETAFYLWWVLLRLTAFPTVSMKEFVERKQHVAKPLD